MAFQNKEKLRQLIGEELIEANKQYGYFCSKHEAYAVLLEEVEELQEALDDMKQGMSNLWRHIRNDIEPSVTVERGRIIALDIAEEAIQVAAMWRKLQLFLEQEAVENAGKAPKVN